MECEKDIEFYRENPKEVVRGWCCLIKRKGSDYIHGLERRRTELVASLNKEKAKQKKGNLGVGFILVKTAAVAKSIMERSSWTAFKELMKVEEGTILRDST